jgi:tRNA-2-methylthio-N6-dimethylallyladenosine synthase
MSDLQAWVTIMTGCDHKCAFCVVPLTRGPEHSRPSREILREARQLAGEGYKELTLLGQTVNSYRADIGFPELLSALNEVDGIERIRFITSHPKDVSADLIEKMSTLHKVCEHLHLPVQAGSDRVLEAMARGYTSEYYRTTVEALREAMPEIGLSSDIIVGFPGETEEDFRLTLELLEAVEFESIFLFKYSPRPDTPASEMPRQVPDEVKQRRFQEVLDLQARVSQKRNEDLLGKKVEVLVEGASKKDPNKFTGRTRSNKIVHFPKEAGLSLGALADIVITQAKLHTLEGIWARHFG